MEVGTLMIPVAFAVMLALALWCVIDAKGKWWIKAGLIIIFPLISILIWVSLDSYKGWPTNEDPPEQFVFIWGEVVEPNKTTGDPGVIYLWLIADYSGQSYTPFEYTHPEGEPRAHKVPYSRELHENVEKAKLLIKSGKRVGVRNNGEGEGPESEGNEGENDSQDDQGENRGDNSQSQGYEFYELPPPKLPEKD